jgi:hypothetical protein
METIMKTTEPLSEEIKKSVSDDTLISVEA